MLASVEGALEKERELRRRGADFNVFQLLRIEGSEDELHSRFIAELLNPRGAHGQGDSFLRFFLEKVGKANGVHPREARVKCEHDIGPVVLQGEDSEGGRIDIFITDGYRHLSIENKIWAEEGEKQVTRYCNYDPKNFVLFLTLDGHPADTTKRNYRPISYVHHIIPWLEACRRHAADYPALRETIKQYIRTVTRLAMPESDNHIWDAMKKHHKAAYAIRQDFDGLVRHLVTVLAEEVKREMKKRTLGGKWEIRILTRQQTTPGLTVRNEIWRDSALEVRWEWDYLGIYSPTSPSGQNWVSDEKFREKYPRSTPDGWRYWRYVRHRFNTEEGIEPLFDELQRRGLAEFLASELVYLANYCDEKFRNESS